MLQVSLLQPGRFEVRHDAAEPHPAPGEALVRVRRIGVCGTDLHAFAGRQPFFQYPRVLGHELGVEVVDPGSGAPGLRPGDRCSVEPYLNCGDCIACRRGRPNCCTTLRVLGVNLDGGMQPLLAIPATKLHPSATLDFDQLALVETLGIGAHAIERAGPRPDDFLLVAGAGPIGLSTIQFGLMTGARLAVLDLSETRLAFCREQFGVKHTFTPGPDLAERLRAAGGGELPTIVIDATGNQASMAASFELVAHGGRIVFVGLFQGAMTFDDPNFHRRELTLCASRNAVPETFTRIIELIEAGRIDTRPWITHRTSLDEVPAFFAGAASDPSLLKCMIEV